MSLKPIFLKGFKRTPYIDVALAIEPSGFAGWTQILYEHFSRECIKDSEVLAVLSCFHSRSHDSCLKDYLEDTKQIPFLQLGKFDGQDYWGVEALLSVWGVLQSGKYNELLLVGGQAFSHEDKLLFQKKDHFDARLLKQAEILAREMKLEREVIDKEKINQVQIAKQSSSQGLYAHELLSVFAGEGVRRLIKTDQLPHRSASYQEINFLPSFVDQLRGVISEGNTPSSCTAQAMMLFSTQEEGGDLILSDYLLFPFSKNESWADFLERSLKVWEQKKGTAAKYSRIEFVELSVPHALAVKEAFQKSGVDLSKVNQWGGSLGKGFCSPIESLTSLGHLTTLKSGERGLLVVTHSSGHVLFLEAGKS